MSTGNPCLSLHSFSHVSVIIKRCGSHHIFPVYARPWQDCKFECSLDTEWSCHHMHTWKRSELFSSSSYSTYRSHSRSWHLVIQSQTCLISVNTVFPFVTVPLHTLFCLCLEYDIYPFTSWFSDKTELILQAQFKCSVPIRPLQSMK